jgi:hypothetical protein
LLYSGYPVSILTVIALGAVHAVFGVLTVLAFGNVHAFGKAHTISSVLTVLSLSVFALLIVTLRDMVII